MPVIVPELSTDLYFLVTNLGQSSASSVCLLCMAICICMAIDVVEETMTLIKAAINTKWVDFMIESSEMEFYSRRSII